MKREVRFRFKKRPVVHVVQAAQKISIQIWRSWKRPGSGKPVSVQSTARRFPCGSRFLIHPDESSHKILQGLGLITELKGNLILGGFMGGRKLGMEGVQEENAKLFSTPNFIPADFTED